jgi:hypothetical protein
MKFPTRVLIKLPKIRRPLTSKPVTCAMARGLLLSRGRALRGALALLLLQRRRRRVRLRRQRPLGLPRRNLQLVRVVDVVLESIS